MMKYYTKLAKKQADLTVFALDPQDARAPFAPPGYTGGAGVWVT